VENHPLILVVEDDQLVQNVVEDCLSEGGFEAIIASPGENAVELLDAAEGKYRALVTDINLSPGELDGWHVARHAREIDPNFPIVYMSGKEPEDWPSKGVPNSTCWRSRSRQRSLSPPFLSYSMRARQPPRSGIDPF
jgi:CheY-like chemotaxis protein